MVSRTHDGAGHAGTTQAATSIKLPEILAMPPKLLPIVTDFNKYDIILLEGGRASAKSNSAARLILFLGEKRRIRVVCGRDIESRIELSVYALLRDLVQQYGLAYQVMSNKLVHRTTGTEIWFMGFREQENLNIKGLEGVDILWIDEAEGLSKQTLDIIMPTIRKAKSRVIFTMNRYLRDDAVTEYCTGKSNCLHIKINYFENPYCSARLKQEAEDMKRKSERDYRHIWLGEPLQQADDYLFNYEKLNEVYDIQAFGERFKRQRVMAIDFAAQGNDQCVATVLDRLTNQHWKLSERIPWDEPDTMVSVGRIINLIGQFKPDVAMLDIGGMGKPVWDRLCEAQINITPFDGGSTNNVDIKHYANWRAKGYFTVKEWVDNGFLIIDRKDNEVIKQLEKIRMKYRSNGSRLIQAKVDMKKDLGYSPDDADSLMMAVVGAQYYLSGSSNIGGYGDNGLKGLIKRVTGRSRRKL